MIHVEPLRAAWIRSLAAQLVRDGHTADDLAQEAWIAASRAAPQDEPSFRNWIAAVLSRLARKRERGEANRVARERSVARREAIDPADEVVDRAETHRALVQSVLGLEEPYRSTLLLRYFDELSPSDIAARQGVPVRTVKTRLTRGLERLRERLDREHRGGRAQWLAALAPLVETSTLVPATVGTVLLKTKLATALGAAALIVCVTWLSIRGARDEPASAAVAEHRLSPPTEARELAVGGASGVGRAPEPSAAIAPRAETSALDPERALGGTVVDSRGRPVAGAHVSLFRSRKTALGRTMRPMPAAKPRIEATSDALGAFELPVECGPALDLRVEATGFASHDSSMHHAGERVVIVLTRPARIAGRVTSAADGGALAGATVRAGTRLVERSWRLAETGADGTYEISDLPEGDVQLIVDDVRAMSAHTEVFFVAEGAEIVRDFALAAGCVARGIVTDARNGAPIAGARVARSVYEFDDGPYVVTDASGAYVLPGIDERMSSITVGVRADGYAVAAIRRAPEPEFAAEFALERGNGARGRVLDAAGWPLAGVEVTAIGVTADPRRSFFDIRTCRTGADGTFVLANLRRDTAHDLRLLADGHSEKNYAFPEDEGQIEQVDFGDLRLSDPGVITARAVDARGEALVGWWVRAYGGNTDRLHFTEGSRDIEPRTNLHEGITDGRGRFVLGDLAAGPYHVNVSLKGSVAFVDREVLLAEERTHDLGDLTIDVGLAIEGVVVDQAGHPISGASVEAYGAPDSLHRLTYTLTDSRGRFTIRGLAEGLHDLQLDASIFSGIGGGRAVHAKTWIRAIAAGTDGLRLVPERSMPIRGIVLDLAGERAADVYVDSFEVGSDPEGWPIAAIRTDSRGQFELPVAGGKRYVVHAVDDRSGFGPASLVATVDGVLAGSEAIELRLAPRR